MKYKWTPLQILALVIIILFIYQLIAFARMKGEPGIGGLALNIYAGFAFITILADLILQAVFYNLKKAFFIAEGLLIAAFLIWLIV